MDGVDDAGRGVAGHIDGQRDRRVTGAGRQRVGAGGRQRAERGRPARAADGGRRQTGGQNVRKGHGAAGGGKAAVGDGKRVGAAVCPWRKPPTCVLVTVKSGSSLMAVVSLAESLLVFSSPPPERVAGVDDAGRGVVGHVHGDRDRRITGPRRQRIGSRGRQRERDLVVQPVPLMAVAVNPAGRTSFEAHRAAGRCIAAILDGKGVLSAVCPWVNVPVCVLVTVDSEADDGIW